VAYPGLSARAILAQLSMMVLLCPDRGCDVLLVPVPTRAIMGKRRKGVICFLKGLEFVHFEISGVELGVCVMGCMFSECFSYGS